MSTADALSRDPDLALIAPFLREQPASLFLYQLFLEIRHGVFSVNDASLARVKLGWWRDELEAMLNDQASHPATRALSETGDTGQLDSDALGDSLDGIMMRLEPRLYNDEDELLLHAWRQEGALAVNAARLAGAVSKDSLAAARDFGLAHALGGVANDFEAERRSGRLWLPASCLQEAGVESEDLLKQAPDRATLQALMRPLKALAESRFDAACRATEPAAERPALRAPALLASLSLKTLRQASRKGFEPAAPTTALPRLFTAWRAARRETRLAN